MPRTSQCRTSLISVALTASAVASFSTACSEASDASTAPASAISAQQCAKVERANPGPQADLIEFIGDWTGSARTELQLPPGLIAALVAAQKQSGDRGTALQVINVNGAGVQTKPSTVYPLDPSPGDTSPMGDDARTQALQCVPEWIGRSAGAEGPGTDLLSALATAERQRPTLTIVMSDGVNTTSELNLDNPSDDPAAEALRVGQLAPDLVNSSTPITWFNMGERQPPMSQDHRGLLMRFWQALLGQRLAIDTRTGSAQG